MNYKLVAVDLDGTLLTPELDISDETIDAIRKVTHKNVMVTLSTGRMFLAAIPLAHELELDVPIITCNGALTKCSRTGKVFDKKIIPKQHYSQIIKYCQNNGLSTSVYSDDEIFTHENSANMDIHREMDIAKPRIISDMESLNGESVIKILFNCNKKSKLNHHSEELYNAFKNKLTFYFSLPYFVEIVNKDANKRTALENLCAKLNISRKEIIAIGDNFNDLEMIRFAGLGVAMGNAPDYLKQEADFVTHSNDEDGVRYVLEKFVLKNN
ncbi:Cof-type HAD-IIB family hydrolase [Pseudobacteroides cellulosolvens]|uniref:Cof-like hydrolase n=1 Tax=Pseudobacteroides cellulosolvens ATCC 35603 = DSM 2933 TaxID=398512 RepID=A0A0L6JQT4_9FIRM|nr:Cof-type HAD-IIB family hydrolase [Pseudobacteroides cellulosolvens]KNY28159.1 Cof-like hydrolase [Pseudobacteroides cellulosolvens ATCC 35603 = DSM 2933]